jgi:protein-tyrosine-phosphatase
MRVLFVCSGNAHRSPLAEALLKQLRPDWKVDSAGLTTTIPVSKTVRDYLKREGATQYLKQVPESLNNKRLDDYDVIVTMEERHKRAVLAKCPECRSKIVVWNIRDPYFMQEDAVENIYNQIKSRVQELALSNQ